MNCILCCAHYSAYTLTIIINDGDVDSAWRLKPDMRIAQSQTEPEQFGTSLFENVVINDLYVAAQWAGLRKRNSEPRCYRKLVKVVKNGLVCGWKGHLY